jgi:hypothetical protein
MCVTAGVFDKAFLCRNGTVNLVKDHLSLGHPDLLPPLFAYLRAELEQEAKTSLIEVRASIRVLESRLNRPDGEVVIASLSS